jgi:hypothetical protein
MLTRNPAKNIDEVIARLTDIIDISRQEPGRMGYFAALYRKVTIKVKQGVLNGRFEDGARMERLDVNFANRYLEAYERRRRDHQFQPGSGALFGVEFRGEAEFARSRRANRGGETARSGDLCAWPIGL